MIVTEREAGEKCCPQRLNGQYPGTPCMASRCMGWKWLKGFSPAELEARSAWNPNPEEPKGYCGV